MKNKYGLTQAELDLADRITAEIMKNIQAKGLDFNKVLNGMKAANDKLEAKVVAKKKVA